MPRLLLLMIALLASITPAQRNRPAEPTPTDLAAMTARLGSQVTWRANDPALLSEGRNRREVAESRKATIHFDRTAALDTALLAAEQEKRPILWYIPRITAGKKGRQMYRPALLDGYMNATMFTDPFCVDLINRKFVAVRLGCDEALGKRFGIEAPDVVEPALVFTAPDGTVLRRIDRIRTFSPSWFRHVLLNVLSAHPELDHPSVACAEAERLHEAKEMSMFEMANERLRDGDRRVEMSMFTGENEAESLRLMVLIARHNHPERARKLLGAMTKTIAARSYEATPELTAAIALEEGRVHLAYGEFREAAAKFRTVKKGPRLAEARYRLGVSEFFDNNETFARQAWKAAAATDPDSPWAWKAAANLIDGPDRTPIGPTVHGFEDPLFRSGEIGPDTAAPGGSGDPAIVARDAFRFLLRMQRENGGWTDSRYAYWPSHDITPNAWLAATAVSCTALLEWRHLDPAAADAALRRGEDYLFDPRRIARGINEECYAQTYRLFYLVRKHDLADDDATRKKASDRMTVIAKQLAELQHRGGEGKQATAEGHWAHEYPNPFCTAAALNALHLARERGADVPERILRSGAEALLRTRNQAGAFMYSAGRKVNDDASRTEDLLKDSMGRGPICEAAILWAGAKEGSHERVTTAVDNFWKFLPRLEKIRKCDFHTDGELGGFFFWHAIFHTTESFAALPGEAQAEHRERMQKFLIKIAEIDGSFIDSHEIGKSYGTAMGLLSLKNVTPEGP